MAPVTRQQAAMARSKRSRGQQTVTAERPGNCSDIHSTDSSASSSASCSQQEADLPVAKRTRASLASVNATSCKGSGDSRPQSSAASDQLCATTNGGLQRRSPWYQIAADLKLAPTKHQKLPGVLAAMLSLHDPAYQLLALDAARAVEFVRGNELLQPFLANQQLLPHVLRLAQCSKEGSGEKVADAAHCVLCLVICRAARHTPAAADFALQFLLAQEHQGLLYLLQVTSSRDLREAHIAVGTIAMLACAARPTASDPAAREVVVEFYLALQQHGGLKLLLRALQKGHLSAVAATALEGFAYAVPQLLRSDLLSPQQRRNMHYIFEELRSGETDVTASLKEAVYLLLATAPQPQFKQLLRELLRQIQRHYCAASMQLLLLACMQAGTHILVQCSELLLQLLQDTGPSQEFKHYVVRALQHLSQTDVGLQLLINRSISALLYAMSECAIDTALAAASLMCVLAGSPAGRQALVPYIRDLLQIAVQQRRSDITGIAVQCVGAVLVFGSMGPDGNLMLSPASPGLIEIVHNVGLVLEVMQHETGPMPGQQGLADQPEQDLQQQADNEQQQEPAHLNHEMQQMQPDELDEQIQEVLQEGALMLQQQEQQQAQQGPGVQQQPQLFEQEAVQPVQDPQQEQQVDGDHQQQQPMQQQGQQLPLQQGVAAGQQQQLQEPVLQIRPCAAVSAAMIVNAVAVAPDGLQVLQQEQYLDILLSVIHKRGPAATLAARAVSQVIATAPDSRAVLVAPQRMAIINGLAADVPKIAELGARAAGAGPAALAAAVAALNGDVQDVRADVFRVAGPLVHLLAASAACGVVPAYVDGLARIMHKVPCLTMVLFEAFTHLLTFRDGVIALAPHIRWICSAAQQSLSLQANSAEAAALAGAVSIAAVRASFDKRTTMQAIVSMYKAVAVVLKELKAEERAAQSSMQHAAVQLAQAIKRYRRWPRTKKLQAAVMLWMQQLSCASDRLSSVKEQLFHIKYARKAAGHINAREEFRQMMSALSSS